MERVLTARGEMGQLRILIHSLAFGTLKLFIAEPMKDAVIKSQLEMTLDVMANSLVYWTRTRSGAACWPGRPRLRHDLGGGTRVLAYDGPVAPRRRRSSRLLVSSRRARPARHHRQRAPGRRDGDARA